MANPNDTNKSTFKEDWQAFTGKLGEFNKSTGAKALSQGVAAAAPLVTGGNHSLLGDLGMGVGGAVALANPLVGAAIMAASTLGNAAFGSNVNNAAISDYKNRIVDYSRPELNATDNTTLMNQLGSMGTLNIKKSDLGTQGWFSHAVDRKYNGLMKDLGVANSSRAALIDNAVANVDKMNDMRIEANYAAFGGPLYGYFGDGPSSYSLAMDNLMAKELTNKLKETGSNINTLAAGGMLRSNNFTNGVTMVDAGGSHESNPFQGVPMGIAPDGQPNLVEEGEAIFNDYVFSKRLKVPKEVRNKYKLRGPKDMTFADAFKKAQEESEERENDPISKNGLDNIAMILMQSQEAVRAEKAGKKYAKGGHLFSGLGDPYSDEEEDYYVPPRGSLEWFDSLGNSDLAFADYPRGTYENIFGVANPVNTGGANNSTGSGTTDEGTTNKNGKKNKENKGYKINTDGSANLLRIAEPFANAYAVWSDYTGRTNTPTVFNYIPEYAGISYAPIGEYIEEKPVDINYQYNQQRQQAAAAVSAILGTTSPNKYANILAADYNNQVASGNLLRDAIIANYDNKIKAKTFNRATNMSNSEMGLKAMMDDATHRLAYANAKLSQAKANEDNSNAAWGARAANIKALATSLSGIGREKDAYNWRDMLLRAGVFGTLSEKPTSWSDAKWSAYQDALSMSAYGGKLKKKKRGLTY